MSKLRFVFRYVYIPVDVWISDTLFYIEPRSGNWYMVSQSIPGEAAYTKRLRYLLACASSRRHKGQSRMDNCS
jgi:hypothetical protein